MSTAWGQTNDATRQLGAVNLLAGILGVALGVQGVIRSTGERQPTANENSRSQPSLDLNILPASMNLGGVPRLGGS